MIYSYENTHDYVIIDRAGKYKPTIITDSSESIIQVIRGFFKTNDIKEKVVLRYYPKGRFEVFKGYFKDKENIGKKLDECEYIALRTYDRDGYCFDSEYDKERKEEKEMLSARTLYEVTDLAHEYEPVMLKAADVGHAIRQYFKQKGIMEKPVSRKHKEYKDYSLFEFRRNNDTIRMTYYFEERFHVSRLDGFACGSYDRDGYCFYQFERIKRKHDYHWTMVDTYRKEISFEEMNKIANVCRHKCWSVGYISSEESRSKRKS